MLVHLRARPDDVEQPRHDVDLDVELAAARAPCGSRPGVGSFENATITRSTSSKADELRQAIRACRGRVRCSSSDAAILRLGVDEADEVDPVLGMLQDLAAEQLADVAGADDDAVLNVREAQPRGRARGDAAERDERERERPEQGRLLRVDVDAAGRVADDPERPGRHGDQVEDADEIVGGRVLGALLVVVVEPVEPREDDPRRAASGRRAGTHRASKCRDDENRRRGPP